MGHTPVPFPSLGRGLNLRDKADAVQPDEAIDCIDVEFTERGVVKERAGYTNLTVGALTNRAASLEPFYTTGGTKQILAGCDTRLEAISSAGAVVASDVALTSGTWDFARFAAPNNERAYAGSGSQTLRRWDGAAWTNVANTPQAGALAIMAMSNRLVAGRFNGTAGGPTGGAGTSSPSHVYFSNVGDPETWGTNNFIQITPGDGEKVQAVVAWREFIFIFKETKIALVTGESQDAAGNPIFNYRMIDSGVGLASPRAVAVGERGVYFMDRRGVYLTSGNDPVLLSEPIKPIFQGGASPYYLGGAIATANITNCAAHFHRNRFYLAFPSSTTNDRVLVYDEPGDWWSLYDMPAAAMCTFRPSNDEELMFAQATGTNHVNRHNSSQTSDAGAAITSRWRGGWFDLGSTLQKRVAEVKLWGSGKALASISVDYEQSPGTLTQLDMRDTSASTWDTTTWSGSTWAQPKVLIPQLVTALSAEGSHFSVYFENSTLNQTWSVDQLVQHVAGEHIPPTIGLV